MPSTTTPDPKMSEMLWIQDAMLPSRSTTARYTVFPCPSPGVPACGVQFARSLLISAARLRAYAEDRRFDVGTVEKRGSPIQRFNPGMRASAPLSSSGTRRAPRDPNRRRETREEW